VRVKTRAFPAARAVMLFYNNVAGLRHFRGAWPR
jgi:hypothetical protein